MISTSLYTYLTGISGITDIVDDKIYPHHLPQGNVDDIPALTIQLQEINHDTNLSHPAGVAYAEFQLDCFSWSNQEANQIAEELRKALHGFAGDMAGTAILYTDIIQDTEAHEVAGDGSDVTLYRRVVAYKFKYRESVGPGFATVTAGRQVNWGKSAYEIATSHGFTGTEEEWLESLQGGGSGSQGPQGEPGEDGLSAYQIAVANGFVGNEAAWLLSLVGADGESITGPQGEDGNTIYTLAGIEPDNGLGVAGDYAIDKENWLIYGPKTTSWPIAVSLVGPQGETGDTGPAGTSQDRIFARLTSNTSVTGTGGGNYQTILSLAIPSTGVWKLYPQFAFTNASAVSITCRLLASNSLAWSHANNDPVGMGLLQGGSGTVNCLTTSSTVVTLGAKSSGTAQNIQQSVVTLNITTAGTINLQIDCNASTITAMAHTFQVEGFKQI